MQGVRRLNGSPEPPVEGSPEENSTDTRELAQVLDELGEGELSKADRARLLTRAGRLVGRRLRTAGLASTQVGRWLTDLLLDLTPHLTIRDLDTLHEHYQGRTGEDLAEGLTRNAARVTAAIGAAGGAAAAVQWTVAPTLVAVPAEILAETLAVAVVEVRLVAELHQVYGVQPPGSRPQRATAYVMSWTHRRGVDPFRPWSVPIALGIAARRQVARRLLDRFGRNVSSFIPFLIGSALGARFNRKETLRVATEVRADLAGRSRVAAWQPPDPAHRRP